MSKRKEISRKVVSREAIREGMTKQEWVQRYLEDILNVAWKKGINKEGIDLTEEANKARAHLTKWGVVIKVDELPIITKKGCYYMVEPQI